MKTSSILDTYQTWLTHREYSPATIQKYTKALARFFADTGAGDIPTRETVAAWRDSLTEKGYTPATVNAMLAAVNDCQESIDNVAGKAICPARCMNSTPWMTFIPQTVQSCWTPVQSWPPVAHAAGDAGDVGCHL